MGNRLVKFGVGIAVLVGSVVWLGVSGYEEGKAYYKTADEFVRMDRAQQERRTRLMGNVVPGSIRREGGLLTFSVALNGATVPVVYRGTDPVPDTFKDGVEALVEGSIASDGRFAGSRIQAKCASKYEADPASAYRAGATAPPAASGAGAPLPVPVTR